MTKRYIFEGVLNSRSKDWFLRQTVSSSSSSVHSKANLLSFLGGEDTDGDGVFPDTSPLALFTPRFSLTKLSSKCSKSLRGPDSLALTLSVKLSDLKSEWFTLDGEPTGRPSEAAIPEATWDNASASDDGSS